MTRGFSEYFIIFFNLLNKLKHKNVFVALKGLETENREKKQQKQIRAMISMEVQSTVHIQHLNHSHGLSSLQSQHQSGLMHQHQLVQDEKPPKSKFNLRFVFFF